SAGTDDFGAQIRRAVEGVEDGLIAEVKGNGVDGEVAAAQITVEAGAAECREIQKVARPILGRDDDAGGVEGFIQDVKVRFEGGGDAARNRNRVLRDDQIKVV